MMGRIIRLTGSNTGLEHMGKGLKKGKGCIKTITVSQLIVVIVVGKIRPEDTGIGWSFMVLQGQYYAITLYTDTIYLNTIIILLQYLNHLN